MIINEDRVEIHGPFLMQKIKYRLEFRQECLTEEDELCHLKKIQFAFGLLDSTFRFRLAE